jgi:hypothetical protein
MRKKGLGPVVALIVSMFASGVCAQSVPQLATPVTSDMFRKLQTIPSRATQINTLMANPTTKAIIDSVAKTKNISLSQLSATGLAPVLLSPNISCPNVPWTAGVKFTPFIAAPICRGPWGTTNLRMAESYADNINNPEATHLTFSDLVQKNCLPLLPTGDRNARVWFKIIMPPIRATYLITIHAVSMRSNFPLSRHLSENVFVSKYQGANITNTSVFNLYLTPLSDDSGLVGIISANTSPEYQKQYPYLYIYSQVRNIIWEPYLLFGGITITQL